MAQISAFDQCVMMTAYKSLHSIQYLRVYWLLHLGGLRISIKDALNIRYASTSMLGS